MLNVRVQFPCPTVLDIPTHRLRCSMDHTLEHERRNCFKRTFLVAVFKTLGSNHPSFHFSMYLVVNIMLQPTLITLLNSLIWFIASIFQAKELPQDEDFSHDHPNNDKLQKEAYAFLELEPPSTMEQLKKQYKRLSLRYHPDRNNGSQESHEMQQKLNASFNLIQQALEGTDPVDNDDEDNSPAPYEEQKMQTEERPPENTRHRQHTYNNRKTRNYSKSGKMTKGQRKRARRAEQRQEDLRAEMAREMRQENSRWESMQSKVNQEQANIRRRPLQRLNAELRQAMSRDFMNKVSANQNINDNPTTEKPKNHIMEACTDPLAVAIRLGMEEFMLHSLNEESDIYVRRNLQALQRQALREGRNIAVTAETLGLNQIRLHTITRPLDDDGNTILHYAVYWEKPSIIRSLVNLAQQHLLLDQIMMAKNVNGHTPSNFARAAIDASIKQLMQSQEVLVKMHREQTKIGPASVKAGKELATILRHADWATTLCSILGYWVGARGFRLHFILCMLGVAILQNKSYFKDDSDEQPYFFEIAMTAYYLLCSVVVHFIYPAMNVSWWLQLILLLVASLLFGPLVILSSPLYIFEFIHKALDVPVDWMHRKVLSMEMGDGVSLSLTSRRFAILGMTLMISVLFQTITSWTKPEDS